jgi:nucleoside-diphosphate-sugar epimerase
MILVIGAKGGVGTTLVAQELVRSGDAVGFDLADGQLAARLERTTWPLAWLTFVSGAQRREMISTIVQRRYTLVWSAECSVSPEAAWQAVRDIAARRPVVIDGGIAPTDDALRWSEQIAIVTAENDVARWHAQRWIKRFPHAVVIAGTKEAARAVAAQIFQVA